MICFYIKRPLLVGMTRLERATPWSQTKYTTNCTTSRFSTTFKPLFSKALQRYDFYLNWQNKTSSFFYFLQKEDKKTRRAYQRHALHTIDMYKLYYLRVTIARRLRLNGSTSATPPTPETWILERSTPRLTSSSATACARASESFWL